LIHTNHVSLRWLIPFKNLEEQLTCSVERLQQY